MSIAIGGGNDGNDSAIEAAASRPKALRGSPSMADALAPDIDIDRLYRNN
ncbi:MULTISPECIES: hypothetical protein [Micromonospora]|nr:MULTISPECIES: hypothetical protein [unclassified Micromonospora]MBM0224673.1 hypothetical protein [Micromonospora sp. ATA51]